MQGLQIANIMATTVDTSSLDFFSTAATSWWEEEGQMSALHAINRARIHFVRQKIETHFAKTNKKRTPFMGLTMLDIGCGGGIATEPLARLGGTVTGIDAGAEVIKTATAHAEKMHLEIKYQNTTVEQLAETDAQYDVVMALEVIEHVKDYKLFLSETIKLLKPTGLLILSTLNRTALSYALGIVAAERLLKWVPKGAHEWQQFLKPSEINAVLEDEGLKIEDINGFQFQPLRGEWDLSKRLDVNYIMAAHFSQNIA